MAAMLKLSDPRVCAGAKVAGCVVAVPATIGLLASVPYGGTLLTIISLAILIMRYSRDLPTGRVPFSGCMLAAALIPTLQAFCYHRLIEVEANTPGHVITADYRLQANILSVGTSGLVFLLTSFLSFVAYSMYQGFLKKCSTPAETTSASEPNGA